MSGTVVSTFLDQARANAEGVAFRSKRDGEWQTITWAGYEELVRALAGGLRSLGFDAGDKASILSANRYEWHVADVAIQACGGVTVPIYPTNSTKQVAYIAGHSESKVMFCENATQLAKVMDARADVPALVRAVVFDGTGVTENELVTTFDALLEAGRAYANENPKDFDDHVAGVRPDDLATLVYTSGTTGPPKGAMLTHANIVWTAAALDEVLEAGPGDRKISYLPLSHIAERMTSHFLQIYQGSETWFATSIDALREELPEVKPSIFFGVPRVWEKFYAGIQARIASLDPDTRDKAEQAIQLGLKRVEAIEAGTSLPPELEEKYEEANNTLFKLVRMALGLDEARALVSGAAPINPEVLRFFHAIGLRVIEVYGQTEDCGPTSINRVDRYRIGTVGPALPGVEMKIAGDGEILVKGGNVGLGYYKDPLATSELIDEDGWMHSGDIGEIDADGFLRITDRKKDLIITAAGKNVAPQVIENMLKYSPWISQTVVIGDNRPYLTALITLDAEKVGQFAEQKGIAQGWSPELVRHPDVQQLVETAVAEVNENLARVEQIKRWHVFDRDFEMEQEELTPTLKVRRKAIIDKYSDIVESLYEGDGTEGGSA